ncbi:MAG: endonuclease/exonuclease/phosphatase family protein [Alloprevotella sp.]|nr:endonuclease/exonuclease/phosphatase family protein [Alloprevotella sp.]
MKHLKRVAATALLLAAACLPAGAQELLVGSYNIRYRNSADSVKGNGWERRCPVVCDLINFMRPDVFGAQEVLKAQLDDMEVALPEYAHIGVGRDDGRTAGEYEAIFFRPAAVKLLEEGHFWLSETPEKPGRGWDAACTRICTWGKFRSRHSRRTFYFFNLHLDHVGVVARRESARLVLERIREIAKGAPVILTGDFNVDQRDEIYTRFVGSGLLKDSYEHARYRFAENGTFNSFRPESHTDGRIDHVFVSPAMDVLRYGVLTGGYWTPDGLRLPSDHYPVFTALSW